MKTNRSFNRQNRFLSPLRIATAVTLMSAAVVLAFIPETRVNVGSPTTPFSRNKQTEPAIAVDANHTNVLVAGANDNIDMEACNAGDDTTCPFTPGVGTSGVYFSFNSGTTWVQPTYTGLTARGCTGAVGNSDPLCTPHVGPIGTLPWYYEASLVADGDPAVAFGPRPGANGKFSWANGSRLYYATLVSNLSAKRNETFKGYEAVAVSRMDAPSTGLTATIASNKANWKTPVIVTKQNGGLFSDKEQIWADNAASSPFFGDVYVCSSAFHGTTGGVPVVVSVSRDGGNTWVSQEVTKAISNAPHGYRTGCTIRSDSHGVVYLAVTHFATPTAARTFPFAATPGIGSHELLKSFDGGHTWTKPVAIFKMNDACYHIDPVFNECTEDGIAGARSDLAASPALDIANGAPTGAGATNEIVDAWVDGRGSLNNVNSNGFNHEKVLLSYSTTGGASWLAPRAVQSFGDRGFYAAPAISPDGHDLYVVYNAFTTPFRNDTTSPRGLVGVVKHADINIATGMPGAFSTLHRGAVGDPRGSSANSLVAEFLGDYVYAVATNAYGAGVWNDVRNAAVCPAIDTYRLSLQIGGSFPTPAPQQACVPTFGNSDIFGGSYPDPTP
jgi:hypothetical protein